MVSRLVAEGEITVSDDPGREDLWNQEILLTQKGREALRGDETLWRWDRSTQTMKRDAA